MGQMGKTSCPIISIQHVFDNGRSSPWKDWVEIKFEDGTTLQLMEKPK